MALQYCPKCSKLGITWYCDDGDKTFWYCTVCGYEAEEIAEEWCETCDSNSVLVLQDQEKQYRYCLRHEHERRKT